MPDAAVASAYVTPAAAFDEAGGTCTVGGDVWATIAVADASARVVSR